MKSNASKMAGPGGISSYISHISTQLYRHCNFGLGRYDADLWSIHVVVWNRDPVKSIVHH